MLSIRPDGSDKHTDRLAMQGVPEHVGQLGLPIRNVLLALCKRYHHLHKQLCHCVRLPHCFCF